MAQLLLDYPVHVPAFAGPEPVQGDSLTRETEDQTGDMGAITMQRHHATVTETASVFPSPTLIIAQDNTKVNEQLS